MTIPLPRSLVDRMAVSSLLVLLHCTPRIAMALEPPAVELPPSNAQALPLPANPRLVLESIDARAAGLSSLRYGVIRTTRRLGTNVVERWRFVSAGSRFRVDYSGDTQRQLAFDGRFLMDYLPAARKARRIDMDLLSPDERSELLSRTLEKVNVPGFRVGVAAVDMHWVYDAPPDGYPPGTIKISGSDTRGGSLSFILGNYGAFLLKSEIREQEKFILSVEASDHIEIQNGLWFPRRIEINAPEDGGNVLVQLEISQVFADESLPDSLFRPSLDPSITIEEVP